MTNDFVLFPDAHGGDAATHADIALITAFLSQELSPVQIAAVQDRLDSDNAFRERVQPIIELWIARRTLLRNTRQGEKPMAFSDSSLTAAEVDAGWRRYAAKNASQDVSARRPALQETTLTSRWKRIPVSRIAAVLALSIVPLFAVAMMVKYIAAPPGGSGRDAISRTASAAYSQLDPQSRFRLVSGDGDVVQFVEAPLQYRLPISREHAPQAVPLVDLPAPTVRTQRTFGAILGIKHTDEGRVLVNDAFRQQLWLLERDLVTASTIFDSIPGTSKSYSNTPEKPDENYSAFWRTLRPFRGDSAVFGPVERSNGVASLLVIDGRGNAVRTIAVNVRPFGTAAPSGLFFDDQARPMSMGIPPNMRNVFYATFVGQLRGFRKHDGVVDLGAQTVSTRSDTIPILRLYITANRADTIGVLNLPEDQRPRVAGPFGPQQVGNGGGRLVPVTGPDGVVCRSTGAARRAPGAAVGVVTAGTIANNIPAGCTNTAKQLVNPLYPVDDWAVLSDGTVAFVRGQDYHIDWIHPDGTKSSSAKLPFEWKRLTDADKQRIVDSTRTAIDSLDALAAFIEEVELVQWRDSVVQAARASGAMSINQELAHPGPPVRLWPYEIVPLSQVADYYPPIRVNASKADADGNLWILPRMTSLSRRGELVYDVVNPTRGLAQRVRLPLGRSIAGFGKGGVVYLQYGDLKNGFVLERSTLPTTIAK